MVHQLGPHCLALGQFGGRAAPRLIVRRTGLHGNATA
jgi:hypothetical protein